MLRRSKPVDYMICTSRVSRLLVLRLLLLMLHTCNSYIMVMARSARRQAGDTLHAWYNVLVLYLASRGATIQVSRRTPAKRSWQDRSEEEARKHCSQAQVQVQLPKSSRTSWIPQAPRTRSRQTRFWSSRAEAERELCQDMDI